MGSQMSRINRIRSLPPATEAAAAPARTMSEPIPGSNPPAVSPSDADLSSYEAACRSDPELRSFDSKLEARTSRAINSIAVGLDFHSLSIESLSTVTDFMLENNELVVQMILQNKREIWKNQELSDLVDDYFKTSLLTLDFCSSLDACLKRVGHVESIMNVALRKFQEEHQSAAQEGSVKNYSRTLEELRNFRTAGDPFTQEFFKVLDSVSSHQSSMMIRLQAKKKKLDKKLRRLKAWRKVSNVIFVVAFASVLICSVVAAAVSAPPVVTALAAAAAVPLGSMGRWINSVWKKYEGDVMGQRQIINTMQIGSFVVVKDLDSIKRLVEKFQIQIEDMLAKADFATREGEESVVIAVEEIKRKMDVFVNTIRDLRERAAKCNDQTRRARTVVLKSIMWHPRSSDQGNDGIFW